MTYTDVLRIRPYRNLWIGQSISQIGDAMYYVSFMFMVKKVTGSGAMVGYTGALEAIPFLLFGPYAGVLADRIDRRLIMMLSDLLSAVALMMFGSILIAGILPPAWSIFLIAFLLSTIRCFFMPAKSAAIPALVPADHLMTANSLSGATATLMPALGLVFSASVLAILYAISPRWFFLGTILVNAASFAGSAWFISRLPRILPDRSDTHEVHPVTDFVNGWHYVRRRHDLKVLIALVTVLRLSMAPFFVAYVIANDLWWGGPKHLGKPQTLAWIELVFFVGMIVSSITIGKMKVRHPAQWFCWGLAVVGGTVCLMAFSPQIWLFCIWNLIAGLSLPAAELPINTYCQLSVEDAFRGRTNSVLNMIASTASPLGMGLGGLFVAKYGLPAAFLTMGGLCSGGALIGLIDGKFRRLEMPTTEPAAA